MDDLDKMEKQMDVANAISDVVVAQEPPQGGSMTDTAKEWALKDMPQSWRERIIADAADFGIKTDGDAAWLLVGAYVRAWAGAGASGAAAKEVADSVGKIQAQIFAGAVKAGNSVKNDVVAGIEAKMNEGGQAIVAAIGIAADAGSVKIKAGSLDLISKLDAAIEAKKVEGVDAFAKAASDAATKAAKAASARRFMWSVWGVSFLFFTFATLGWAANSEYLSLSHQLTPAPLVINPKTGKVNCGKITVASGKEEVCEIR
ncbi:hypothetical protein [Acidithiobacillus ferriphilus]|uniref:hypothetical protein n=1 Tax=Acidithiobacillus ferriphilus TaxID=1689834 RepID=UPI002DB76DE7|nr:hypothetical protein [Acidithiobacillus ferriphilus]MEB8536828.1 hypothetical protein [Acidithiobacillus ferriphilus]